jgi:hypothetical protein
MTTIWHVQAAELAALNWQLASAQQQGRVQANLHQVLHETEQMAQRVRATRQSDPFAAAVLAFGQLRWIHGISAAHFHDYQAKRAWSDACDTLDAAVRGERQRNAAALDSYTVNADCLAAFQSRLGASPDATIEARRRERDRHKMLPLAIGAGVLFFLGICTTGISGGLAFLLLAVAGFVGVQWLLARSKWHAANGRLEATMNDAASFQRFLADPSAGAWLRQAWSAHPLLLHPPVLDSASAEAADAPPQTVVERQVVERQIVVARCRYCKQLSPIDRPSCEHCGAAGFGS